MRTNKRALAPTATPGALERAAGGPAAYYAVLFEQSSDAIAAIRADGTIDAANRAFEEMSGYVSAELLGENSAILVPNASREVNVRAHRFEPSFLSAQGTYEDVAISRKDGYVRYVDLSVRMVVAPGGEDGRAQPFGLAVFRDVTEKKRMERELITKHSELRDAYFELEKKNAELHAMQETLVQSGKLSALGELSAGIAHELNQPLLGIRGYAQELQEPRLTPAEAKVAIVEIISNADKMAAIISHLRAFIRKSTEGCEAADVHTAIEEALKMLKRQFDSRGIEIARDFGHDVPKVYANPLQLEQVFINLATNARDAIEATGRGKGKLTIRTRRDGSFAEVAFEDDGVGMAEKTRTKAFNPFFTTKEVGKGMGLGLSLSYGILSKIQGSIVVESELGKGAKFLVRLPRDFRELA